MSWSGIREAKTALKQAADKKIAEHSAGFFQAFPGGYGEGDRFYGIRVPVIRQLAKQAKDLSLDQLDRLLQDPFHEMRLLALVALTERYGRAKEDETRQAIYRLYLDRTEFVNNWDLVDASAHKIVGEYLLERDRKPLQKLRRSRWMWDRRIAIIATYRFIKNGETAPTWELSEQLLGDKEDLMHKAVGWMLREAGKVELAGLRRFLKAHAATMPRTMLRYSIEKLSATERQRWMRAGR